MSGELALAHRRVDGQSAAHRPIDRDGGLVMRQLARDVDNCQAARAVPPSTAAAPGAVRERSGVHALPQPPSTALSTGRSTHGGD
ncbi:hypothetical protein ACIBW9_41245 [Streptomyces sp. NPDC049541]|uniref:hypothetical protein n=1 Tax=Streptomyces sp. NPDC049541 TaxID=3365594 RepID=UPI0037BD7F18